MVEDSAPAGSTGCAGRPPPVSPADSTSRPGDVPVSPAPSTSGPKYPCPVSPAGATSGAGRPLRSSSIEDDDFGRSIHDWLDRVHVDDGIEDDPRTNRRPPRPIQHVDASIRPDDGTDRVPYRITPGTGHSHRTNGRAPIGAGADDESGVISPAPSRSPRPPRYPPRSRRRPNSISRWFNSKRRYRPISFTSSSDE